MHGKIAMLQTHAMMCAHELDQLDFWKLGSHLACALLLTVHNERWILPQKYSC